MKYIVKIDTVLEINTLKDLEKLRTLVEANGLDKPNYSKIGEDLGVDRRTVKKYYEKITRNQRKVKQSKIDGYHEIIKELLSDDSIQKFYYKSHLYRYLSREHTLKCGRSNFNYYIG